MQFSRTFRQAAVFCTASVFFSSVLPAQPPERGGQENQERGNRGPGGQEGGRGQRGGFGGGGFGGGAFGGGMMGRGGASITRATLLGMEQIRKELMIEEAQATTIDAAIEAYREERRNAARPDFQAIQGMSEEERTAFFEKMQKDREEATKKSDADMNALLEADQVKRLDEIVLQAKLKLALIPTLKGEELAKKLSLTEDQTAKLTSVEEAANAKRDEAMAAMRENFTPGGDREQMREMMEKMQAEGEKRQKETETEAMAVLTDEQKSTLEGLKGKTVELDARMLRGGGFGGGGFGGPGGPGGGFGGPGGGPGGPGGGPGGGRGGRGGRGGQGGGGQRPPADDAI
ncbi:MAG: Spy/CpxP family protein refolding chaperone [Planctomyces sp.]|nr:Spy/CpxP family protein refolding chaperone [Planctomyces sp.]